MSVKQIRKAAPDESQRAIVAAKVANMEHGGNRKSPIGDSITQANAAQMLNVSERAARRAWRELHPGGADLRTIVS